MYQLRQAGSLRMLLPRLHETACGPSTIVRFESALSAASAAQSAPSLPSTSTASTSGTPAWCQTLNAGAWRPYSSSPLDMTPPSLRGRFADLALVSAFLPSKKQMAPSFTSHSVSLVPKDAVPILEQPLPQGRVPMMLESTLRKKKKKIKKRKLQKRMMAERYKSEDKKLWAKTGMSADDAAIKKL